MNDDGYVRCAIKWYFKPLRTFAERYNVDLDKLYESTFRVGRGQSDFNAMSESADSYDEWNERGHYIENTDTMLVYLYARIERWDWEDSDRATLITGTPTLFDLWNDGLERALKATNRDPTAFQYTRDSLGYPSAWEIWCHPRNAQHRLDYIESFLKTMFTAFEKGPVAYNLRAAAMKHLWERDDDAEKQAKSIVFNFYKTAQRLCIPRAEIVTGGRARAPARTTLLKPQNVDGDPAWIQNLFSELKLIEDATRELKASNDTCLGLNRDFRRHFKRFSNLAELTCVYRDTWARAGAAENVAAAQRIFDGLESVLKDCAPAFADPTASLLPDAAKTRKERKTKLHQLINPQSQILRNAIVDMMKHAETACNHKRVPVRQRYFEVWIAAMNELVRADLDGTSLDALFKDMCDYEQMTASQMKAADATSSGTLLFLALTTAEEAAAAKEVTYGKKILAESAKLLAVAGMGEQTRWGDLGARVRGWLIKRDLITSAEFKAIEDAAFRDAGLFGKLPNSAEKILEVRNSFSPRLLKNMGVKGAMVLLNAYLLIQASAKQWNSPAELAQVASNVTGYGVKTAQSLLEFIALWKKGSDLEKLLKTGAPLPRCVDMLTSLQAIFEGLAKVGEGAFSGDTVDPQKIGLGVGKTLGGGFTLWGAVAVNPWCTIVGTAILVAVAIAELQPSPDADPRGRRFVRMQLLPISEWADKHATTSTLPGGLEGMVRLLRMFPQTLEKYYKFVRLFEGSDGKLAFGDDCTVDMDLARHLGQCGFSEATLHSFMSIVDRHEIHPHLRAPRI